MCLGVTLMHAVICVGDLVPFHYVTNLKSKMLFVPTCTWLLEFRQFDVLYLSRRLGHACTFVIRLFNIAPLHSLKYSRQRLSWCNRGLVLSTFVIKFCQHWAEIGAVCRVLPAACAWPMHHPFSAFNVIPTQVLPLLLDVFFVTTTCGPFLTPKCCCVFDISRL